MNRPPPDWADDHAPPTPLTEAPPPPSTEDGGPDSLTAALDTICMLQLRAEQARQTLADWEAAIAALRAARAKVRGSPRRP